MSQDLYLVCLDHDPPIYSAGEVGTTNGSINTIKRFIENRDYFVAAVSNEHYYPDFGDSRENTAAHFFSRHPKCKIVIRDSLGKEY